MLKAIAGNMVIFGLSKVNIEKLQEGKPISIDGEVIGLPGRTFVIMYGETEAGMKTDLLNAAGIQEH